MPLISAGELAGRLGRPGVRVFDVRADLADPDAGRASYDEGHLPGAVFVDLERDLTGSSGPGRHPLPRPEEFSATARRIGIGATDLVVAYDDNGGVWASRLWWMLRSLGHERSAVLDGGVTAWIEDGRPMTRAVPRITPGSFPTRHEWSAVVDREGVASTEAAVIDARTEERFRGDHEPIDPLAGHIPGARNLPYSGNLAPDGRFLDPSSLSDRFADLGPSPIVYCGSGVTACHDLLAMELAGITDARLYEGSWSDWSRQADAPVATC